MKLQKRTALSIVLVMAGIGIAQATCYVLFPDGECAGQVVIASCDTECVGIEPSASEPKNTCLALYDGEFPDTQGGNSCDTAQITLTDEVTLYEVEITQWPPFDECWDSWTQ